MFPDTGRKVLYHKPTGTHYGVIYSEQEHVGRFIAYKADYTEAVIEESDGAVIIIALDKFKFMDYN